jgi:hypothetical protein
MESFKYTVRNIPPQFSTQKSFYTVLCTHLGLRNFQLTVNFNKTALLITQLPITETVIQKLKISTNSKDISVTPINLKTKKPSTIKQPTFSLVIKKVGHDITPDDVIAATSLKIIKAWRITSKKTDRPTTLIRIIITERESLDALLLNGINLFGRNYECEASHPPAPTPVQCAKCFQFGIELAACLNKQVCPQCPNSHPPNKCPEKDPICTSCKGPHPAWSRTCPILKEITITDDTPVLPVKIIDPPAEFADPCSPSDDSDASDPLMEAPLAVEKGIISFTMKALFDLFPLQKAKIQKILEETSKAVFNVTTKVSHSGHKIHFTYDV